MLLFLVQVGGQGRPHLPLEEEGDHPQTMVLIKGQEALAVVDVGININVWVYLQLMCPTGYAIMPPV